MRSPTPLVSGSGMLHARSQRRIIDSIDLSHQLWGHRARSVSPASLRTQAQAAKFDEPVSRPAIRLQNRTFVGVCMVVYSLMTAVPHIRLESELSVKRALAISPQRASATRDVTPSRISKAERTNGQYRLRLTPLNTLPTEAYCIY